MAQAGRVSSTACPERTGRVTGLILAAGLSSRMGGKPKALARLAGKTLLERAVVTLRQGCVDSVLVVTGHGREVVEEECHRLECAPVHNAGFASGMFSSVQCGIAHLTSLKTSGDTLLLPVDAALVLPRTIRSLLTRREEESTILIPSFLDVSGHPPLIPAAHFAPTLSWPGHQGLRGYLASLEPEARQLCPEPDAGIVSDLDTPLELERAEAFLAETRHRADPSLEEAWHVLAQAGLSPRKIRHSALVAIAAGRLCRALARHGFAPAAGVPPTLPLCAGLLHDVDRARRDHAKEAALRLRALNWEECAVIVGAHTDFPPDFLPALGIDIPSGLADTALSAAAPQWCRAAAACVHLADKYVHGETLVPLRERFAAIRERWAHDSGALEAVAQREAVALALEKWLTERIGETPLACIRQCGRTKEEERLCRLAGAPGTVLTNPL